jgi:formiminotetrahydrofolate cyclodeaminase
MEIWMQKDFLAFRQVLDPEDNQTGGGAASAIASSMGAALVGMVARLSIGRREMEPDEFYQRTDKQAQGLSQQLMEGAEADSAAFDAVMSAYRQPKDTEQQKAERSAAIQKAMVLATETPLANARWSVQTLDLCVRLKGRSNTNAASDLACAHHLALAGLRGALSNVSINLSSIKDPAERERLESEYHSLLSRADGLQAF